MFEIILEIFVIWLKRQTETYFDVFVMLVEKI